MSLQMFIALTYVPCVAFLGMSYALEGNVAKLLRKLSIVLGGFTLCLYALFIKELI